MSTTIPAQQPRRRLWLWVVALGLGALVVGSAWKTTMRYQAASELRAAGFWPGTEDVWQVARDNWRGLFDRETWRVDHSVEIHDHDKTEHLRNLDGLAPALHRLAPTMIFVDACPALENVDGLKGLTALTDVDLNGCYALRNVDALKELTALQEINLSDCYALQNVDALHSLKALKKIDLRGCSKLSPESVAALKAALPNATIIGPEIVPAAYPPPTPL